jgi:hypothetical protein
MSLSRHLWHQRQRRRLDRHDGFALLFEHVPARIDARHAFVVLVQKRVCTENLIPVDDVMESPKLAE